jgi:preprotein translocase subunit YajC
MLNSFILFAEEEVKKGATEQGPFWQNPIILLPVMFALFYFIVLRPQQRKQRQEQENMMSGLKKNDEVVTAAGIIGIVSHIKENGDEVTLKIDDNARIRVLKSSIIRIMKKDEPPKEGTPPAVASTPAANTSIKPT